MDTTCKHVRENEHGELEFHCIGDYWVEERYVCHYCQNERNAGRYCEHCWPKSGFRDACDPHAVFDPMDAGESLEPID